jgi:Transglycosylase-like domain
VRKLLALSLALIFMGLATSTAQARDWNYLVFNCEAKGVPNPWYANTGNGFFFGPQFAPKTWHANGGGKVREMDGYGPPMKSYSIAYIIRIAESTYQSQGPWAWPWCHAHGYI